MSGWAAGGVKDLLGGTWGRGFISGAEFLLKKAGDSMTVVSGSTGVTSELIGDSGWESSQDFLSFL